MSSTEESADVCGPDSDARIEAQRRLVVALADGERTPFPSGNIEVIETHISWVVLAGAYAYKLKKSLNLGFLDFSTLEKRHFSCAEEVRLNRRTAPDIYIDVIAIAGSIDAPCVCVPGNDGGTPVLEYAVRMHRFAHEEGLDFRLGRGELTRSDIVELAAMVANFHAGAERASGAVYGTPALVQEQALQNFTQTPAAALDAVSAARLRDLRRWTESEYRRIEPLLAERARGGFVRECHGDLHLANLVRHGGRIVAFDCIEFNPALRWIDVASDLAFTLMDLRHRGRPDFARVALNAYLEYSADWDCATLLPFYLVYRAMVRAKVAAIRAGEHGVTADARAAALADMGAHLELAAGFTRPARTHLVITCGLSGSGKSHIAARLVELRDHVWLRADVERKRMAGIGALERSGAALDQGMYSPANTARVYAHLAGVAESLLAGGNSVVVDATCLKRSQRDLFRQVAVRLGVQLVILAVGADRAELARRITARAALGNDASEATHAVLDAQIASAEPLGADEMACALQVDTGLPFDVDALAARIQSLTPDAPPRRA